MNPLIAEILAQHYPRGRWDAGKAPPARLFRDDATSFYDRTDPGKSLPGECVHDFFAITGGKFKCHWCGEKV